MRTPRQIPASVTRWGLLLTTIGLCAVLVGTGIAGWFGALETSRAVTRARGLDMVLSIRRAVVRAGGDSQGALDEALIDLEEQGLRYVAVIRRDSGVTASAGEPLGVVDETTVRGFRRRHGVRAAAIGARVQVITSFGPGYGRRLGKRGWFGKGGGRPWSDRWSPHSAKAGDRPIKGKGQGCVAPMQGGVLVLEFEPVVARTVTRRAMIMLIVTIVAATMLLLAALVFWRLSRRAEEMADQLARDRQLKALGQMSAVLGHELRNPLASLKGHAQLLVERLEEGTRPRKGAERVVREALRMERLTEQILDFARQGTIEPTLEDPADVARSAVEQVGSGIELVLDDDLPESWQLDRIRIERVLINFLKNALQASTGDAIVDLIVRLEGEGLLFEVRDRGEGLPEGEMAWIFEPFHTKRVQGTGLGLAVSKQIIEAHGGRIDAANHQEVGAVFSAWLPPVPVVTGE